MTQFRVFRIGTLKKLVDSSIAVIPSTRYYQVMYPPPFCWFTFGRFDHLGVTPPQSGLSLSGFENKPFVILIGHLR